MFSRGARERDLRESDKLMRTDRDDDVDRYIDALQFFSANRGLAPECVLARSDLIIQYDILWCNNSKQEYLWF